MTLEIPTSTHDWILQQMEFLIKTLMTGNYTNDYKLQMIGEFHGLQTVLANSGYESLGLKFKVIIPTNEEYKKSLPDDGDSQ